MLLFCYGSLMRGGENHHRLEGSQFLGTAETATGFTIFQLDGSPGMVPGTGSATGELYAVSPRIIQEIDRYEVPYRRQSVRLNDGLVAWYYQAPEAMLENLREETAEQINRNWLPQVVKSVEDYDTEGSPERVDWLLGRGAPPAKRNIMDAKTRNEIVATLNRMGRKDLVRHVHAADSHEKIKTDSLRTFSEEFSKEFDRLAKSGGVTPEEIDYGFAKIVLYLTADRFKPSIGKYTKMLNNLKHF